MSEVFICMPGKPVPKGRPRAARIGGFIHMYTPKTTQVFETACAAEAMASMQGREPMSGPIKIRMEIFVPIPASYRKADKEDCRSGRKLPTATADIDNIAKSVMDAFNGVVWLDDSQVVDAHLTKRFADEPCITATVTQLDLQS